VDDSQPILPIGNNKTKTWTVGGADSTTNFTEIINILMKVWEMKKYIPRKDQSKF